MNDQKVICEKCNQKSPRNMHNKCIYCGTAFQEEHHFAAKEVDEKLIQLEKANEDGRRQLDELYKKEKKREEERRKSASSTYNGGGFF